MVEFDETDKLEKKMLSGATLKVPGFVFDDEDDSRAEAESSSTETFDIDNFVMEVSEIIDDLTELEKTKYVKLFEKDGEFSIGIHNSRMKALAKRKSTQITIPGNGNAASIWNQNLY